MRVNVKIVLRTYFTRKDGSHQICLRLTINRKVKYLDLNASVKSDFWDSKTLTVKKAYPNSYKINLQLNSALNRANQIIFEYNIKNKPITISEFERLFNKPEIKGNSFYDFAYSELEVQKPKISFYTYKTIKGHLSKLKGFSPELSFFDITLSFIHSYDNYMISLGNVENTRSKAMAVLKSILNKAIKAGHLKENVFKQYPITKKNGNREFLTKEELEILEKKYSTELPKRLKNVLKYFLFSCYTGLRYQDVKALKHSNIDNNMVSIVMHKTKEIVTIPLTQKAKKLINPGYQSENVFKVYVNQITNRYLKDIIESTPIKKNISFHCARHTFATIGISLEIPIEVISKLLGHSDLQTTQIYAKVINDVKIKQMEKWDLL